MTKIKSTALVLALVGSASLLGSWALAFSSGDTKRDYPENVLAVMEDAHDPRQQIDETHPLDLEGIEEIVVRSIAIDAVVSAGASGGASSVQLRTSVPMDVKQALQIERENSRLILSTDEHEKNGDDWRFSWGHDSVEGPKGLRLVLPPEWRGRVNFESVSGDLDVEGSLMALESKTVSGDLKFRGRCEDIDLETVSGDAELELGAGSGIRVDARSVSGDLEMPGLAAIESPGQVRLQGQLGAANTRLRFESVSGDLEVKRPASL
jgi:hypothetical protein